ncbi:MAG: PEP/pyruvate-binding domain-containing protein [Thermodesulfovibrionales bacterium]
MKGILGSLLHKRHHEDKTISEKYRFFRTLLNHNKRALGIIAEMEQLYYSGKPFTLNHIRIFYEELLESVTGVVICLEKMTGKSYNDLLSRISEIDSLVFEKFQSTCTIPLTVMTIDLEDITPEMKRLVGMKSLNLAIIKNQLGINAPNGFVITSYAFENFLKHNKLHHIIHRLLGGLSPENYEEIEKASEIIRSHVLNSQIPQDLSDEILKSYNSLEKKTTVGVMTAVRSSAVGEDTEATFAGQYETILNVRDKDILDAYKKVIASKYSPRSITYRLLFGLDDKDTPMAALVVEMIDAKSSGVLYTVDPAVTPRCPLKVTSIFGIGEQLVSGKALSDTFLIDRIEEKIIESNIVAKDKRISLINEGGIQTEDLSPDEQLLPSVTPTTLLELRAKGLMIEEYFESPQDIEWAIDREDRLYILQSRNLNVKMLNIEDQQSTDEIKDSTILIKGGETASSGVCAGSVFVLKNLRDITNIEGEVILVTEQALPDIAKHIGSIKGIITDYGGTASHMASVAREFGIPALFGTKVATSVLQHGQTVTLWAEKAIVYDGIVEKLLKDATPTKKMIFQSAVHIRMREVLDNISPLNLIDAQSESFKPQNAKSFHDIIRYTHEISVRDMFGISLEKKTHALRLITHLPLTIWIVLLSSNTAKTDRDKIDIGNITSIPFKAMWSGFTHPGVNWEGTMSLDGTKFSTNLSTLALSEITDTTNYDSYAVISDDYMNLSIRFAYHFATIDALCVENSSQNYISLQFSGGGGNYYGKTLRISLLSIILDKLGFEVITKGDLIEATYSRHDKQKTIHTLEMLGRLLASTRLLDMTLSNQQDIVFYADEFFKGNYDFLRAKRLTEIETIFYIKGGNWSIIQDDTGRHCLHDGSYFNRGIMGNISTLINKMFGTKRGEFISALETHHHFPLAIVKEKTGNITSFSAKIKILTGKTEKTAGILAGLKNLDNYLALSIEPDHGQIAIYEMNNGKRKLKASKNKKIDTSIWHMLYLEINTRRIRGYLNGVLMIDYETSEDIKGYAGIWSKGDTLALFDSIEIQDEHGKISYFKKTESNTSPKSVDQ